MKMKKLTFYGLLSIIFFAQCKNEPQISQWRGPARNGIFPEKGLLDEWPKEGPELLWKFEDIGMAYTSVVFGGEKIFTLGTKDSITSLYALNTDGELLWKKEMGLDWTTNYPGARSTPLVFDGKGYVINGLGVMFCFNVDDGSLVWKRELLDEFNEENNQWGIHENLVIEGDKLFCTLGGKEINVLALNKETGENIWVCKGKGEINAYNSPTIIEHREKKYYITLTNNSILSVDIEKGQLAWSHQIADSVINSSHANVPIYKNGMLLVCQGYGYGSKMFKLSDDGLSAEVIWKMDSADVQIGDAVVIENNIYVSSTTSQKWYCLDWDTGEIKFSTKILPSGTIIAADNKLFIQTFDGNLSMISVENNDFKIKGAFKVPGKGYHFQQPIIRDGKLYTRRDEIICVYDIRK